MELEYARPLSGKRLEDTKELLTSAGLMWDASAEFTVSVIENGKLAATGSRSANVLKCVAVADSHAGEGITATVISELAKDALDHGHSHIFLFTKPQNTEIFESLGFYIIAETKDAVLMENRRDGIQKFVAGLQNPRVDGITAGIVANCNPFTNGHRYLIETAAKACGIVHLFILSEDRSAFSADARRQLVKAGVKDLPNVIVHPTGDYLVSFATFPDYFIKDRIRTTEVSCALDLAIFAQHFAKPMGITRRYVGGEPNCSVTAAYNRQMAQILPEHGIEVIEIPRLESNHESVSASVVRRLMESGDFERIRQLVPDSTFEYIERTAQNVRV